MFIHMPQQRGGWKSEKAIRQVQGNKMKEMQEAICCHYYTCLLSLRLSRRFFYTILQASSRQIVLSN